MGLFSKRSDSQEPSFSRVWISETGGRPRKLELAVATIARMASDPVGGAAAWGESLDGGGLRAAGDLLRDAVRQDRSLVRHVSRDLIVLFEANGGIGSNEALALGSVGLDPSMVRDAAAEARAVARAIRARREGNTGGPNDLAIYRDLFEDASDLGDERAIRIGAWSALVVARMASTDRLPNGALFLEPGMHFIWPMEVAGWYPNPVNAGDTGGDASIERWWDGEDWTDRARIRDGRRWQEAEVSLLKMPSN
jgi:hypothetical protein